MSRFLGDKHVITVCSIFLQNYVNKGCKHSVITFTYMPSSQGLCMSFEEKCKNIATHGLLTWSLKKIVVAISLGFFFRNFSYIVNVISRHYLIHCINHFFLLVKFALYPSDMFLDCPRLYKWSTSVSSGTRSSNTFFFCSTQTAHGLSSFLEHSCLFLVPITFGLPTMPTKVTKVTLMKTFQNLTDQNHTSFLWTLPILGNIYLPQK